MEITKITLTDIRCIKHFEVNLNNQTGAKKWLVLLGDNGVGKTTILRSIALGLCEESGASGLMAEVPGDWIRNGCNKGTIRIELKPYPEYKDTAYIETTLERSEYNEVKVSQEVFPKRPESFDWEKLFVCGYGTSRGVYGTEDLGEYAVTDSVYTLFNYKSRLQNPELILRRWQSDIGGEIKNILIKLENILILDTGAIELTRTGIIVKGKWGKAMPLGSLGDGYISTLTWLSDMYGWKLLLEEHSNDVELNGIVIIDEIEQHLHPKWQKQIIKLLSQQFPKVQFITSTHSSLCVIGTTDLEDSECCIAFLSQDEDSVSTTFTTPPRNKRADQVLTSSYLFDLDTASDNAVKEAIQKYYRLYKRDRNKIEEEELQKLKRELEDKLGSTETDLEKLVEKAVNQALVSLTNEANLKIDEHSPSYFEITRQLKKLFNN